MRRTQEIFEEALFIAEHYMYWGTFPVDGGLCPATCELVNALVKMALKGIPLRFL